MPAIDFTHMDGLAMTALGFLVAVLVLTLGLFGWLGVNMMKPGKPRLER